MRLRMSGKEIQRDREKDNLKVKVNPLTNTDNCLEGFETKQKARKERLEQVQMDLYLVSDENLLKVLENEEFTK